MKFSVVIPAFNAAATIGRTLQSVTSEAKDLAPDWEVETIVVDDGSADGLELRKVVESLPTARLVTHPRNQGMCAARNSGIRASTGDVLMILDADDAMAPDWPAALRRIVAAWPANAKLCYATCRNEKGRLTVSRPGFTGLVTFEDLLRDRFPGEYVPLFRGDYVREKLYVDLGTRKSCGLLSYLTFASDAPIWITSEVMRTYREGQPQSVTRNWAHPAKAAETAACYEAVTEKFGESYRTLAPRQYRLTMLRLGVYRSLARRPQAWRAWRSGATFSTLVPSIAAAAMMILGAGVAVGLVKVAKRAGLIKPYG